MDTNTSTHGYAIATEGGTFHQFAKLPVEIRIMIWEEFYREPRNYTAEWRPKYTKNTNRDSDGLRRCSHIKYWTWNLQPAGHYTGYYNMIDSGIDSLSRRIAHSIRQPHRFPVGYRIKACIINQSRITPGLAPIPEAMRWQFGRDTCINWDLDYVLIDRTARSSFTGGFVEWRDDWWREIRNLVLEADPHSSNSEVKGYRTEDNSWLWRHRNIFNGLKVLRRVHSSSTSQVHTEWAHFQTRYLLREGPDMPLQWREMTYEMASKNSWNSAENVSIIPQWSVFLERLRGLEAVTPSGQRFQAGFTEDMLKNENEVSGAKRLFGYLSWADTYLNFLSALPVLAQITPFS